MTFIFVYVVGIGWIVNYKSLWYDLHTCSYWLITCKIVITHQGQTHQTQLQLYYKCSQKDAYYYYAFDKRTYPWNMYESFTWLANIMNFAFNLSMEYVMNPLQDWQTSWTLLSTCPWNMYESFTGSSNIIHFAFNLSKEYVWILYMIGKVHELCFQLVLVMNQGAYWTGH